MTIIEPLTVFVEALGFDPKDVIELHLNGNDHYLTVVTRSGTVGERQFQVHRVQYKPLPRYDEDETGYNEN